MDSRKIPIVLIILLVAPSVAVIAVLTGFAALSAGPTGALSSEFRAMVAAEAEADLGLAVALDGDGITSGNLITYGLVVTNHGPNAAEQLVLTDAPCCALTHQAVSGEGWTCTISSRVVTCELATLASGQVSTVTVIAKGPKEPMTVWTTGEVSSRTPDPDLSNNRRRLVLLYPDPGADMWLKKRDSADPVVPGALFSYTITVRNSGPYDAEAAVVTDTLPTGMELRGIEAGQGSCSGTVCSLGPFPAFGRATVTMTVAAPASEGVYTNTVVVGSETLDQIPSNNVAYEPVQVRRHTVYLPAIWRSFLSVRE